MKFSTFIAVALTAGFNTNVAHAESVKTYEVVYIVSDQVTKLADLKCATFYNDTFTIDMAVAETPFDWTNEYANYMCRIKRTEH